MQNSVRSVPIEKCTPFARLGSTDIDPWVVTELEQLGRVRRYGVDETVLAQDDPVAFIGTVVSGVLRMQKTLQDGRSQVVGLSLPSDMFGRPFERVSRVSIEAATDVTLCCCDRAEFEELVVRSPKLKHFILLSLIEELRAAQDWMLLLGCQSVTERVATFLLLLLKRQAAQGRAGAQSLPRVTVPVGRRDMAGYLGTTVESISRSVRELAEEEAIHILGAHEFEIIDLSLLTQLSGRDKE